MLLRHTFLEETLATLYFRRALDLANEKIDPMNDTMAINVPAATAGHGPLRTYHSSKCIAYIEMRALTNVPRGPIPCSIPTYQPSHILWASKGAIC